MPLFAADLERLHGAELARPPLSEARLPYLLYKMLQERRPRIDTPKAAVKTWFGKYRLSPDEAGERAHPSEELERVYGDRIRVRHLAHQLQPGGPPDRAALARRPVQWPLITEAQIGASQAREATLPGN